MLENQTELLAKQLHDKAKKITSPQTSNLLEQASQQLIVLSTANERMREIILKHVSPEHVCEECKHSDQCKQESKEAGEHYTRFWRCSDGVCFELTGESHSNDS